MRADRVDELTRSIGIDAEEIAKRKAFLELGEGDIESLRELYNGIDAEGDQGFFVDGFYEHLFGFPDIAHLISDEATFARLRRSQSAYFRSLVAGHYDADYVRDRLRIGDVHERVGLDLKWYLGAYNKYLGLLIPKAVEVFDGDHGKVLKALKAVLKVFFLDAGLAADAYMQAKERSVRTHAEQLQALHEVALTINGTLSLGEVMTRIMQCGMDLIKAEGAWLAVYDEGRGRFRQPTVLGLGNELVGEVDFGEQGMPASVLQGRMPIHGCAATQDLAMLGVAAQRARIGSFFCAPLTSHERLLGVMCFYRRDQEPFSGEDVDLVDTFSKLASQSLENALDYASARGRALTDSLTGLPNRWAFQRHLDQEWQRVRRRSHNLALLLLDIDYFKSVNDTYGHGAGDAVLVEVGHRLQGECRVVDFVARYGGEEFAIILPETDGQGAKVFAERLRRSLSSRPFTLPNGAEIGLTASIGAVSYLCCRCEGKDFVEKADQALYVAKRSGRDREVLYCETLKAELEKDPEQIVNLLNESLDFVPDILEALGAKAPFFINHPARVERVAVQLGTRLGLASEDLETLAWAARLHDLGMVYVADEVLNKPVAMTEEGEWSAIRHHAEDGANLLRRVPALAPLAPVVRHHHERLDGSGYPDGLVGGAIPYLARLLAVADVFCTITEDHPFRRAVSNGEAAEVLLAGSGKQFDADVVAALVEILADIDENVPGLAGVYGARRK